MLLKTLKHIKKIYDFQQFFFGDDISEVSRQRFRDFPFDEHAASSLDSHLDQKPCRCNEPSSTVVLSHLATLRRRHSADICTLNDFRGRIPADGRRKLFEIRTADYLDSIA